jgi:RNA polymerase sigma-70 factor, ECF subfamily
MTQNALHVVAFSTAEDDATLVRATQNGDDSAFAALVARYDRKLLRIAQRMTHNCEDSQDIVQETFLCAFRHLNEFRGDAQFSTWLIRIAVNQSLMKLRKQHAIREVSLNLDSEAGGDTVQLEFADWAPNPEQLYWGSELRDILATEFRELQPRLIAVFVLRDLEGLSIVQTADVLGLSHASVKSMLFRARLKLRKRLSKYFTKRKDSSCLTQFHNTSKPFSPGTATGRVGQAMDHPNATALEAFIGCDQYEPERRPDEVLNG